MDIVTVNTQRNPVGYLARRFAINYNLPVQSKVGDTPGVGTGRFPTMTAESALALAAFALLRLRTAQLAVTTDDAAAWDAELAAAQAFADDALAQVSATQGTHFPTAQRVYAKLQKWADDNSGGTIPAPGALALDWATNKGAQPVAAALAYSVENDTAYDIDLLSGVTNAENTTETLSVLSVDGKTWELGRVIVVKGVSFTMAAGYHLTAPAAGVNKVTAFDIVISDGVTDPITRAVTATTTTPA